MDALNPFSTNNPLNPLSPDNPLNQMGDVLSDLSNNLTEAVNDGLSDTINDVVERVVEQVGVQDFYYLYIQKVCSAHLAGPDEKSADGVKVDECRSWEDVDRSKQRLQMLTSDRADHHRHIQSGKQHSLFNHRWSNAGLSTAARQGLVFFQQHPGQPRCGTQSCLRIPRYQYDRISTISNFCSTGNVFPSLTPTHLLQHLLAAASNYVRFCGSHCALGDSGARQRNQRLQRHRRSADQTWRHSTADDLAECRVCGPGDVVLEQRVVCGD